MTTVQILLAIITGLAVDECCDVSPWAARTLVRWSAHRRYAPPARAELRAEELAAYIDDRPGKLFKLVTALGFAAAAVVARKVFLGAAPPIPLWQPVTLTVPVQYEEDSLWPTSAHAVNQAWCQLTGEVHDAARELGVRRRSWRRCIKELRRITGDERWILIANNLNLLKRIRNSCIKPKLVSCGSTCGTLYMIYRYPVPTDSTVTHYQAAVETAHAEIRRLANDFLFSPAS